MAENPIMGIRKRLFQVVALYLPGGGTARIWLHRARGVKIGENVFIGTDVLLETSYPQLISIGNNVSISIRAVIIAHFMETTWKKSQGGEPTVVIEDDVFIGPGVLILPNVRIGKGSVIMAGSVLSKSVPPRSLVQGNPAQVIGTCEIPLAKHKYRNFIRGIKLNPQISPEGR
jgi:acetyltransferase-like isoleucine patch superfamily enzyme